VASDELEARCRAVLEAHWREPGFTVPNATTYPWQWLWDSAFHAIVWAHLGEPDRAVSELRCLFDRQHETGFVPHMTFWSDPPADQESFWGRAGISSITQPPMYGHALAELHRLGIDVPGDLVDAATGGLRHLVSWRVRIGGLVAVAHPWETGCDDSPRWDHWVPDGWSVERWRAVKGDLMATVERAPGYVPIANGEFRVAPVGFNALLAWNLRELATVTGDDALTGPADDLAESLAARWRPDLATWVDAGDSGDTSGTIRTSDALLPLLVETRDEVVDVVAAALTDPDGLGAVCGPRGVDRREPTYAARTYWRGPAWPQLTYLLAIASSRHGRHDLAATLGAALVDGAERSGLAEFWEPDTGEGLGAIPQSWTTLAAVVGQATAAARG
jgi:hypothetical protein